MSKAQGTGVFLFLIWTFGFSLLAIKGIDRDMLMLYMTIPVTLPIGIIVFLQLLIWLGRGVERITGRKL